MKKLNVYLVIILLFVLIVPSVALASWWNPLTWNWNIFDWFSKPQTNIVQPNQNTGNFLDQIKNYAYDVSSEGLYFSKGTFGPQDPNYNPKALQLTNGTYSWGPDHNSNSSCSSDSMHLVSIAQGSNNQPLYAIGDLNGDGKDDAVVMLNLEYKDYNKKGTQSFCTGSADDFSELMLIAMTNNNGKLQQTDSYMLRMAIVNGVTFSNITINNGVIALNGKSIDKYKIVGGKIIVTGTSFQAPNLPQGLKIYTNNNFGFSFQYPSSLSFTIQDAQPPTLFKMQTGNVNTEENVFTVSVSAENLSSCVSPGQSGLATELIINGIPFYKTTGGGAAMGTYDTEIQYAAFENGRCYRIGLQYFAHNCDDYLPLESGNTQQEQNYNDCLAGNKSAEALSGIPDIIVSTFKFNQNMVQVPAPTCTIQTNKQTYKLGDVINLTWQSQNATGAFWNQPLETGGTRKNIVPPQGNPSTSGNSSTMANIEGNQTINLKVSGLGGVADCSANINVAHSNAMPSITIDSGTISSISGATGNSDIVLEGTATNGFLYNDAINIVLFNSNYAGPFDEATIYQSAFNQNRGTEWFSGGAGPDLRYDNIPFENWSAKTYAPVGTTSVRVLAYPLYSSSTTSPTQPIVNKVITLTLAQ